VAATRVLVAAVAAMAMAMAAETAAAMVEGGDRQLLPSA
jgi:hypothetical protein